MSKATKKDLIGHRRWGTVRVSQSSSPPVENDATDGMDATFVESMQTTNTDYGESLSSLEWLVANRDNLQGLIGASEATGQIPCFTLQGTLVTKSVHMANALDLKVRDFTKEKNISQREIFEVALIEFFQKYGFEREVATLLKSNG